MIQKHSSKHSNGQILAIGAFSISVLLLAITLNINAAFHSNYSAVESLNTTEDSADAFHTEHSLLVQSHQQKLAKDTNASYSELQTDFQSMHSKTIDSIRRQYISKGIQIDSTYNSSDDGLLLYQLNQNTITNRNGLENWTLINSIEDYNIEDINVE